MSQRIKITYSIRLEDLEGEVARLIDSALLKLEHISDGGRWLDFRSSGPFLTGKAYDRIDNWRQQLLEVDTELGDINNLIASYLNYQNQERQPQAASTEDSRADQMPPEALGIGNLQERLAQFKNAMEGIAGNEESVRPDEVSD